MHLRTATSDTYMYSQWLFAGVVAGQIHDGGDDVIKIHLKRNTDGGTTYTLMVTNSTIIEPPLDTDYKLGTFTMLFEFIPL